MDLHPIFVHFPIALLTIYAILELLRIKKLQALPYMFYIKAILVIIGSVMSIFALITGNIAQKGIVTGPIRDIVEIHSTFGLFTFIIFAIVALIYIVVWIDRENLGSKIALTSMGSAWNNSVKFAHQMFRSPFMPLMAILGLVVITITGALGGSIVYGPEADPLVKLIYKLFGL